MSFNWGKVAQIALVSLAEAPAIAQASGQTNHVQAAVDTLNSAASIASTIITDKNQLLEAQASYNAAASLIKVFAAFENTK